MYEFFAVPRVNCLILSSQPSSALLFTDLLPSLSPTSCPSSCLSLSAMGYSAGLGVVSVLLIAALFGNLVFVIGCVLMRRRHSFDSRK